jgi:hypothetical protein
VTPLHIQIALHYYCFRTDWDCSTPKHTEYVEDLCRAGLLERSGWPHSSRRFEATDGLKAYVEALTAIKLPVLETRWVIPGPA